MAENQSTSDKYDYDECDCPFVHSLSIRKDVNLMHVFIDRSALSLPLMEQNIVAEIEKEIDGKVETITGAFQWEKEGKHIFATVGGHAIFAWNKKEEITMPTFIKILNLVNEVHCNAKGHDSLTCLLCIDHESPSGCPCCAK